MKKRLVNIYNFAKLKKKINLNVFNRNKLEIFDFINNKYNSNKNFYFNFKFYKNYLSWLCKTLKLSLNKIRNEVLRLSEIHRKSMEKLNIKVFKGWGRFINKKEVQILSSNKKKVIKSIYGEKILIAVGGEPNILNVPGKELLSGHSNEPWDMVYTKTGEPISGNGEVNIPEYNFRKNLDLESNGYLNPWWVTTRKGVRRYFGVASGPTSMIIGNHLVVMKISVIDYRSTTNHKLRVEVWYDDFSKLNSGTSSNMFEVSFSKTHDSLNLKVQEDGNIIRLSSKVKKYQNGAFIENVEEREIDMGPPVFTDLSNNDAQNIYRVILRPGYEWLYASAGSNGLGMMKRHSKLPKFGRVGPNVVTYSIDEAESVESFYLNGGLILSRNILEGETPAFNRGLQGLVLSTKAGADGVTTTDGPEYNISTGKEVYLTGIKLYTKALNEAEVFSTYYEYLTDAEKVEFCDDKFEGEINEKLITKSFS